MPKLGLNSFNTVCAVLGAFVCSFGAFSYLLKERYYLSEALVSLIAGLIFSPHAANFIRPIEYAQYDELRLETITLYFSRLVLGVQLVVAGIQLPSRYLKVQWRSLALLLGPGMCGMWICTSLLVWGLVPGINFVEALAVGACVTPTDPVLSNSIVKGKFADKNIPRELQKIIVAESGANDGLGYPFLYLPLYLIKYYYGADHGDGDAGRALGLWFGETWGYTILLSVVYGAVVGWLAKELLHFAEERKYVDRESFLVFAITLALFIVGTCGLIGTDDVLACFVAGNTFTWDDWFRLETLDDSLQPTIDMLLNVAVFAWYGAVCPWPSFLHNSASIPIYRLVPLGLLVLALRRLPVILALHRRIPQIESMRHALFVGFFGPIGVSAVFYIYVARDFLLDVTQQPSPDGDDGTVTQRPDAQRLAETILVVVWFLVICSIVVHGISIPLGKLGFYLPRTISVAISSDGVSFARHPSSSTLSRSASSPPSPHHPQHSQQRSSRPPSATRHRRPSTSVPEDAAADAAAPDLRSAPTLAGVWYRLKRSFLGERRINPARAAGGATEGNISAPMDGHRIGRTVGEPAGGGGGGGHGRQGAGMEEERGQGMAAVVTEDHGDEEDEQEEEERRPKVPEEEGGGGGVLARRTIRFGDETMDGKGGTMTS